MRCEVVAVGTELLLGQVVDTNSAWIGEQLALAGIDCHFHTRVGDNLDRMVACFRSALERSEAVIVCGGLGPTQDDITREAIAEVMGVGLDRDEQVLERIREMFGWRGRDMAPNNERQADVPRGATVMPVQPGTAPGLICPVGDKVIYAVPGVPHEMQELVTQVVIPDLRARTGGDAVILSRVLRTWGVAESTLAEMLADRVTALDTAANPTIAFLASGIEGLKVRITAKAPDHSAATALLDAEEAEVRAVLGDLVFGLDDDTMEEAVGRLLTARHLTMAVAESMTGGMVAARLTAVAGSSGFFRGSIVAYASDAKRRLLGVPDGPVVSETCAAAMAKGAREALEADVGIAVTGVAGPAEQDGEPVGTVIFGIDLGRLGPPPETLRLRLPGDRERIRQFATISLLSALRSRLLKLDRVAPGLAD